MNQVIDTYEGNVWFRPVDATGEPRLRRGTELARGPAHCRLKVGS